MAASAVANRNAILSIINFADSCKDIYILFVRNRRESSKNAAKIFKTGWIILARHCFLQMIKLAYKVFYHVTIARQIEFILWGCRCIYHSKAVVDDSLTNLPVFDSYLSGRPEINEKYIFSIRKLPYGENIVEERSYKQLNTNNYSSITSLNLRPNT
uniref:Uncharacterized protein n=1 Tax=Romanomermis culicivorax TaxID=13658 RepID=A0A915HGK4_ROMCU